MRGHPALLQTTARCGVHARRGGSWPSEGDLTGKRRLDRNQRRWEGKPPVCVGRPAQSEAVSPANGAPEGSHDVLRSVLTTGGPAAQATGGCLRAVGGC